MSCRPDERPRAGNVEALIAGGEVLEPERPTGVLSGRLPEPLDLDLSASAELERLRAEECE